MGLTGKISAWLGARRSPHGNTADQKPDQDEGLRLTVSIGRRGAHVAIGRPGKAGDAPRVAGATEENPGLDDKARAYGWMAAPVHDDAQIPVVPQPRQVGPAEPRQQDPSGSFWGALDPTEREALRSVASPRTFAAGATLMEEGERADHVMVILSGQVKICVGEGGRERVLAVRGEGQIVGERGALQVSVRSATVISLDMISALVIQTKDFAAFVSAHPRVLAIVQGQAYQRGMEAPTAGRNGDYPGGTHRVGPSQPDQGVTVVQTRSRPLPLTGENCTVIVSDVAGFGSRTRTDSDRLLIREVLFRVTQAVVQDIPDARTEDRGDGFLTVVPPGVSTARVLELLLREFPTALEIHNAIQRESARFKLRLALNVGPLVSDMGVSGEAIIVAARMLEAAQFKTALNESMACLGVIASPFVYETTIRHGADPRDLASYTEVPVEVKESSTTAWMKLFEAPASPPHFDLLTPLATR